MLFRGQILLGLADAGWSETYFLPAASMASAVTNMQNICTARMALARVEVKASVIRIVDVTTPRLSNLVVPTTAAGTWAGVDISTVDPALSLMVRMTSADFLTRSRHYLRGIPSAQINGSASDPATWAMTGGFVTAFNAWIAAVIANSVLAVKTAPHTYTTKAISTMGAQALAVIRRAGRPFNLRHGRHLLV